MLLNKYIKNVTIPINILLNCSKIHEYTSCFYYDIYNYNECIIYLNPNNQEIKNCIYSTGGDIIYNETVTSFNFINSYCDNKNKKKEYKIIIDQSLKVTNCFENVKNKIYYNKYFNCDKIINKIKLNNLKKCKVLIKNILHK